MQEIRLWYNNHRKKIWITVGIIAAVIIVIQLLNFFASRNNEKKQNSQEIVSSKDTISEIKKDTNVDLSSTQSAVTGQTVSTEKLKTASEIIGDFMEFCNQGNIEEAYNLLTDKCKEQMYNSLEAFEQAYYKDVFGGEQKIYSVENWVGNIYKVKISENMLATGKSNEGYSKQDYITVEQIEGEYKLNINNYIGYQELNKTTESDNIVMEVLYRNTYMDNEEYTLKVTNNNETAIRLDSGSNIKSLYLEDTRGSKYSAYTHELTDQMLTVEPNETKEVTIKFYSRYVSNKIIDKMIFSNLLIYNDQGSEIIEFKANV